MNQVKQEIKPCPFCGNTPEVEEHGNQHTKKRYAIINCPGCVKMTVGAVYHSTQWCVDTVIKKWNSRKDNDK